jgi:ATP-dependent Clp protease ATP-binding subunit ClpA
LTVEEAQSRASQVPDSADLLVALLAHGANPAAEALRHSGVLLDRVRQHLPVVKGDDADIDDVLRLADQAAGEAGHTYVGPGHLLLGLLHLGHGRAVEVPAEMGVSSQQRESEVISTMAGVLP